MTDSVAASLFFVLLTLGSTALCVAGIVWVVRYGWRSMLGLVALRGNAVLDIENDPLLTHEAASDEEMLAVARAAEADDFTVWEAELAGDKDIVRHLRRMDRWSS